MINTDSMLAEPGLKGLVGSPQRSVKGRAFVGRKEQTAALRSVLELDRWQGAVVAGQGGLGKTALVQSILTQVPGGATTHYLRGTTLTEGAPYGILGLLLGRSLAGRPGSPSLADVLHAMVASLGIGEAGTSPLVVVDNAEQADNWSAMALAELVRTRSIKLLVVCRRINGMPPEFSRLWRRGQLLRVNVPVMDASEIRELMCEELAGPCSLAAATTLWRQSAGSPLYLRALVRQCVGNGSLVCTDGIWVWRDGQQSSTAAPGLGHVKRLMNAHQDKAAILELVAVAGTLPVSTIMDLHTPLGLDELLESDDLEYAGSGRSSVAVAHPVLARVLPLTVSAEQSREWFAMVEKSDPIADLCGQALEARRAWSVACGAGHVVQPSPSGPCTLSAWEPLSEAVQHGGWAAVKAEQILHCSGRQAQWAATAAEAFALDGRQDDALELARALAERLGVAGNPVLPAARTMALPAEIVAPLLRIYTISGEWNRLSELLEACHGRGLDADVSECIEFEVGIGVIHAYQGNAAAAAEQLGHGIAQLKHTPMAGWEGLAKAARWSAATALCHPQGGAMESAETLAEDEWASLAGMLESMFEDGGLPPLLGTIVKCLVAAMVPDGGGAQLAGRATRSEVLAMNQEAELPAQRMLALAAQVDGINAKHCEELLMVASTQEGALAEVFGLYAKGLLSHDSAVLVQTVDRAAQMNFSTLSTRAAGQALKYASLSSIRGVRRQLQRLVHLPADLAEPASEFNAVLTEREEAVGILAANGASNKEIAQKMGVSVRTIEGHLYQVYAKLQVTSRTELLPLLREEQA